MDLALPPELALIRAEDLDAVERLRASLSPTERKVFDAEVDALVEQEAQALAEREEGRGEDSVPARPTRGSRSRLPLPLSPEEVAARVGTSVPTAYSAIARIRDKWEAIQDADQGDGKTLNGAGTAGRREPARRNTMGKSKAAVMSTELRMITRAMTPDELADMKAGYPANTFRRRRAAWDRPTDGQGEKQDAEITLVRKAA